MYQTNITELLSAPQKPKKSAENQGTLQ